MMFFKDIPDDRQSKIDFLVNHFRYNTMNSWNRMTSYANNVKLYRLGLPDVSKAYEFFEAECESYTWDIDDAIREFETDTGGYTAGFNGHSCGYLVMYDTAYDSNGTRRVLLHGIDEWEDFEDWSDDAIDERVRLVQRFDKLCDEIRDILIYYIENTEISDVPVITTTTKRVAKLKDEESED